MLALLFDAFTKDGDRAVLKLKPSLAPFMVAVFPLLPNKPELVTKAREVYQMIKTVFPTTWDDRGNIGKRYLAQDEIGTPWCVTVDFTTLEDGAVTIRNRDTTKQERIQVSSLIDYIHTNKQL